MAHARVDRNRTILVAVDLLALVTFVLVGLGSHHEVTGIDLFARNAIPLVASWCLFAAALKTYRQSGLAPMVRNWLVAVPTALVIRSVWVGSPTGGAFLVFLGVGMAFTMLFLLIGRGSVAVVARRG